VRHVPLGHLPVKARDIAARGRSTPWFWRYEECRNHIAYERRKYARQEARRHLEQVRHGLPCWKCKEGREAQAFRCPQGADHFHWGHGGPPPPLE
jgi:hypothetical protein